MVADLVLDEAVDDMANNPTCPNCKAGDLIKITMTVGGRDLAFATCHHCEAKWWFRDGEEVPLSSVIGLVVQK
jgi:DNA polymerase III alpha subunit (gram-positive type)